MTHTVRLTVQAASRFPDLAGRTGTVLERSAAGWLHVAWIYREGATPADDVFTVVWLPPDDVETATPPEAPDRQAPEAADGPRTRTSREPECNE